MTSPREAWIIDGVRTPARQGQAERRAAPRPPAGAAGPVPERAAVPRTGVDSADDRRRHRRQRAAASATTAPTSPAWPCSSAGWPIATPGRDDQPLLRLRPAGRRTSPPSGVLSGHQDLVVGGGVESMSRPFRARLRRRAGHDGRRQPARAREVPAGPPGHLGRPHRHGRGLLAATDCDELAVDSQERAAKAHRRGPLRPQSSSR